MIEVSPLIRASAPRSTTKWMTESRGNAKVYPREVSSMRSFVTSSLPVCVSPCSDQMTGNVLRMDSRLGLKAAPAIRDRPRVDCGFLRTPAARR